MEKMEKPLSNSPFMPFYAMNFDHRITYVSSPEYFLANFFISKVFRSYVDQ